MDLTKTIEADSTQVNADDLTGSPRTVTITGVSKGTSEQPVNIELAEFPGRAYRPCKSMRRVLVMAWGTDAAQYVGRRMTLFNDQTVKWGGQSVGGVRIAALSHIDSRLTLALTVTRGRRAPFVVEPLSDQPAATAPANAKGLSESARLKWIGRMVELLTEGDCAASEDQAVVVGSIVGREITQLDTLTDDELKHAGSTLAEWSKAGTLGDSITAALNAYVAASVEGSDAATGDDA